MIPPDFFFLIARNAIIDSYRELRPTTTLEAAEVLALPEELPDDDVVSELLPCIRAMVRSLPEHDRQALVLTEYQGLTQKELSKRLGLSFSGGNRGCSAHGRNSNSTCWSAATSSWTAGDTSSPTSRDAPVAPWEPVVQRNSLSRCRQEDLRPLWSTPVSRSRSRGGEETKPLYRRSRRERNHAMSTVPTNNEQLRAEVRAHYARTALQVLGTEQPQAASCCCPHASTDLAVYTT